MLADTLEELHSVAGTIGLKQEWLQSSSPRHPPHYDLSKSKRKLAIESGAMEITGRELIDILQKWEVARKAGESND